MFFFANKIPKLKPLITNGPILYILKASEKPKVFWCFQGVEKECIGNEWAKCDFFMRYFVIIHITSSWFTFPNLFLPSTSRITDEKMFFWIILWFLWFVIFLITGLACSSFLILLFYFYLLIKEYQTWIM